MMRNLLKSVASNVVRSIRRSTSKFSGPHANFGGPTDEASRLRALVASVPNWFHSIDLGHGVVTPGSKTCEWLQRESADLRFPDLTGKSVLDIGAWDGYYSFEAERRNARRVVSLDHYIWSVDMAACGKYVADCRSAGITPKEAPDVPGVWRPDTLPGRRGFDIARKALHSKVEPVVGDFMQMDLSKLGTFDVVLYLGVLYHMQHPLLALQRLASVTREMAVIETHAIHIPGREDHAICEFFETTELNGDPSNWWAPNRKAFEGMCRAAGFRSVKVHTPEIPTGSDGEIIHLRMHAHAFK